MNAVVEYNLLPVINERDSHIQKYRYQFLFGRPDTPPGKSYHPADTTFMDPYYSLAERIAGPGYKGLMSAEFPAMGKVVDNRWIYWGRTIVFLNPDDAMMFRLSI